MELRELHWAWIEQEARAGNLDPLAAELDKPDCGPIPASLYTLFADLARGKRPRKSKSKLIADRGEAEFFYLGCRVPKERGGGGMTKGDAIGAIMDRYSVEHSTAYAAVSRVLAVGDKLAAFPKSQGAIPDDK
jgi:hypothetical protein